MRLFVNGSFDKNKNKSQNQSQYKRGKARKLEEQTRKIKGKPGTKEQKKREEYEDGETIERKKQ